MWLVIRGSSAAQDHWHTSYFRGARSPAVHMTTAQIQTAATLEGSCKSRTLGAAYTGLYRHDEDLESTVRLDRIRAFFFRRPPVPSYCKSSGRSLFFGKDPQTEARRNLFGATQDAEWAWTDGKSHIVQSRDITSRSPQRVSRERSTRPETIHRTRSRSPKNEFSEMLPQPTPAVPPEIGGWLSHRANVAREYNVAMIVGTRGLSRVTDGSLL